MKTEEWFERWFDSSYYHLLYKNRDEKEAMTFIEVLLDYLNLAQGSSILDLACGRGRHAVYLHRIGYKVVGLDLSPQNIRLAKLHEAKGLAFYVHDMREPWPHHRFDLVLNLFTSFGYFSDRTDNLRAICTAAGCLNVNGLFLIDYLNANNALEQLVPTEEKVVDGTHFEIRRFYDDSGYIVKDIHVYANGGAHHFQERVMAIDQEEFERYFNDAGLKVLHRFGDYGLGPFDPSKSERMIFLAQKSHES